MEPPDGRRPAEGDDRRDPVALERSGVQERRSLVVALAVVAILVVAVLKPWASPESPAPAVPAPSVAAALPAVTAPPPTRQPSPAPSRPNNRDPGGQCELGEAWRVFTIEVDAGLHVSSWRPVAPVVATGPDDATIPTVRIVADKVSALGFCGSVDAGVRRPVTAVEAWARTGPGRLVPVDLTPLVVWTPPDPDAGRVFQAADGFRSASGGWAPGDYVFVVRHGPAATGDDWFGVRIVVSASEAAPGAPAATMPRPVAPSAPAVP